MGSYQPISANIMSSVVWSTFLFFTSYFLLFSSSAAPTKPIAMIPAITSALSTFIRTCPPDWPQDPPYITAAQEEEYHLDCAKYYFGQKLKKEARAIALKQQITEARRARKGWFSRFKSSPVEQQLEDERARALDNQRASDRFIQLHREKIRGLYQSASNHDPHSTFQNYPTTAYHPSHYGVSSVPAVRVEGGGCPLATPKPSSGCFLGTLFCSRKPRSRGMVVVVSISLAILAWLRFGSLEQ